MNQAPEPLDDERRYAELEAASPQAAEFEGGGVGVYVGTGALVVAAAIVLLIVLL